MGFLKKILSKKPPQQTELSQLQQREQIHNRDSYDPNYYYSEEVKVTGKKLYEDQKNYLKNNTDDYLTVGASLHKCLWSEVNNLPASEQKILSLTGEGKYYEGLGEYTTAIEKYQEAEKLTMSVCGDEIRQMIEEYGEGDYLYLAPIRRRIRVCKRKLK